MIEKVLKLFRVTRIKNINIGDSVRIDVLFVRLFPTEMLYFIFMMRRFASSPVNLHSFHSKTDDEGHYEDRVYKSRCWHS